MKTLSHTALLLLLASSAAIAQTPTGQEVNVSTSSYNYTEPSATSISIHGVKFGGEYTDTLSLNKRRHWYAQADVRGTVGSATYDGWCSPYLITPTSASPNGYALGIGDPSPCSESGDLDWYAEGRALVGKDLIGQRTTFSPFTGVGLRHLSNGTTGTAGFRTDNYLYVPLGVTARTSLGSRRAFSVTLEVDPLLHGWQKTRDSAFGGGDFPATPTAPPFTINGFSDVSFSQHAGWAIRASAKYQMTRHWSLEPYYVHWRVSPSPVNYETATYTVNQIAANQQIGFYEPLNFTRELGVKLGFHF
jgi:hypothetical protein